MRQKFLASIRLTVAALFAVFATNLAPAAAVFADSHTPNQVGYWQNLGYGTCTKIENPGGTSYTLGQPSAGKYWSVLVVNAANENNIYNNPQVGTAYNAPLNNQSLPRNVSHVIFCSKDIPLTSVTPAAATFNDVCGTEDDTYTIPTTTGVQYKVGGVVKAAGTYAGSGAVTVTAEALAGYTLTGTTSWSHTFTDVDCPLTSVTPAAATFNDVCGTEDDTYTIPTTTGVQYKVGGVVKAAGTYAGSGAVTVTAEALAGYTLTGTASWSHTFTDLECEKVELCHATGSETHPYELIEVSAAGAFNGHLGNSHQLGQDIIPPFTYQGQVYSQNWLEGQAVFENGCEFPDELTPAVPAATAVLVPCVPNSGDVDTIRVTIHNTDDDTDAAIEYTVVLGGQTKKVTIADGQSGHVTFSGLTAGTSYSAQITGDDIDGTLTTNTVTPALCAQQLGGRGGGVVLGAATTTQPAGQVLGVATVLADTGENSNPLVNVMIGLALLGIALGSTVLVRRQNL